MCILHYKTAKPTVDDKAYMVLNCWGGNKKSRADLVRILISKRGFSPVQIMPIGY